MKLNRIDHVALICSDYQRSKHFYVEVLNMEIITETWRGASGSYKLDLALNGVYVLELFTFPDSPARLSYPEACGLRHLAFEVDDLDVCIEHLNANEIATEEVRMDSIRNRRFVFFRDPDGLPIELCEAE